MSEKVFDVITELDAFYENNISAYREMYYSDEKGYPDITVKDCDVFSKIWDNAVKEGREWYSELSDEEYEYMVYHDDNMVADYADRENEEYLYGKERGLTYG